MKNFLLTLSALCTLGLSANAQRYVLYEEFTGENCYPCFLTNPDLLDLMEAGDNPSKIIMIKYMSPIPSAGPLYGENSAQTLKRLQYYSVNSAPNGRMDGITTAGGGHPANMTQGAINKEAAIPDSFSVEIVADYNASKDSIIATVIVTAKTDFAPAGAKLYLRTAQIETLHYTKAPGSNGEKDFENVVRRMYPDYTGLTLPASWTAGESHTYTISGALNTKVDKTKDPRMVAWVQNDKDKKVAQAAMSHITWPTAITNVNKASATNIKVYPNPTKDNATVSVTLANAGDVVITLVDAAGRVVSSTPNVANAGTQQYTINTSTLASGLYYVCVQTADGLTTQQLSVVK